MSTPTRPEFVVDDVSTSGHGVTPGIRQYAERTVPVLAVLGACVIVLGALLGVFAVVSLTVTGPVAGAVGLLVLVAAVGGTPTVVAWLARTVVAR